MNLDDIPIEYFHESNLIENIDDDIWDAFLLAAWSFLRNWETVTKEVICETHRIVTARQSDLLESDRGVYRQCVVQVGGRICPRPFVMHELMHNWILDMQEWQRHDPIKMHVRFEKIHPFIDGNGRVGRLLLWWHELLLGMPPTLIRFVERDKYYKWFQN